MSISDFIYTYFILPYEANQGYNIINSLTYGVLFIGMVYLITKILNKKDFKVTNKLIFAMLPFLLFGSSLRVLEDAAILPITPIFVTPGIYLVVIAFLFPTVALAYYFTKKPERNIFITGMLLSSINFLFIKLNNFEGLMFITTIFLGILITMSVLRKRFAFFRDDLNFIAVAGHMLDATATFVTLDLFSHLGYWEQHPIPRIIGTTGGTFAWFFVLKLIVILVLYYVDKDVKDENLKKLLKFAIIIFGTAPGIRDALRLVMLV